MSDLDKILNSHTETFAHEIAQFIQINNIDLSKHSMGYIIANYIEATRRTEQELIEAVAQHLSQ